MTYFQKFDLKPYVLIITHGKMYLGIKVIQVNINLLDRNKVVLNNDIGQSESFLRL